MAQGIKGTQHRPWWLSHCSGTSEILMVQLRDPVKTLIGTSWEVNIYYFYKPWNPACFFFCFCFCFFTPATAKQLSTLIPDLGISHPSSVSPCFCLLCYLLTICVCQESHQLRRFNGATGLECPWAVRSLPCYLLHCQLWTVCLWPDTNSSPVRNFLPQLVVNNYGHCQQSQSQVEEDYFIIV